MNNGTRKTRILLLAAGLLVLLCCAGTVSAYSFEFITPDSQTSVVKISAGTPLVVEYQTDAILAGTTKRITITSNSGSSGTVASTSAVVQADGKFGATFDTTGMKTGMYTVTVQDPDEIFGSKRTWFNVQLEDRTGELTSTSPLAQYSTDEVLVAGRASETGSRGVELTMYKGSTTDGRVVYGPTWVGTNENGQFSETLPATGAGVYQVVVKDRDGYIGVLTYTLLSGSATSTTTATPTSSGMTLTANAEASHDSPAYFAVTTGTGTATITAFRGVDWTVEYTVNNGAVVKINEKDENADETITITTSDATVYLKVYPTNEGASGTVYLTAKNVLSFAEEPGLADSFGTGAGPNATQSPVGAAVAVIGVLAAAALILSRR